MASESATIVQRLWNYCNVLRDDGVSYGDYVEQLTYLLFLKMDDERVHELGLPSAIPAEYNWSTLHGLDGAALENQYRTILTELGQGRGLIPVIFRKAQNRIQDPAKLRRLVGLIEEKTWMGLDMDVKGEIYEGLLEKNAQDTKSGAGQYFTPRPLIQAMVDVMDPQPGSTVCDPAAGTGGFLIAAHDYIAQHCLSRAPCGARRPGHPRPDRPTGRSGGTRLQRKAPAPPSRGLERCGVGSSCPWRCQTLPIRGINGGNGASGG